LPPPQPGKKKAAVAFFDHEVGRPQEVVSNKAPEFFPRNLQPRPFTLDDQQQYPTALASLPEFHPQYPGRCQSQATHELDQVFGIHPIIPQEVGGVEAIRASGASQIRETTSPERFGRFCFSSATGMVDGENWIPLVEEQFSFGLFYGLAGKSLLLPDPFINPVNHPRITVQQPNLTVSFLKDRICPGSQIGRA